MDGRYRYLAGATAVRVGDEMAGPALMLAALAQTESPPAGSTLLAGLTISGAAGGPVFGALLDRSARPGRLLAAALAGYALGLGGILALLRLGAPLPVTAGVAVLAGLLNPAVAGGWTAQVPRVFGDQVARGNSWDGLTFTMAGLAGPAFAGLSATLTGAPAAVLAASALIALALPAAWRLPPSAGTGFATATGDAPAAEAEPSEGTPPGAGAARGAGTPPGEGIPPSKGSATTAGAPRGRTAVADSAATRGSTGERNALFLALSSGFAAIARLPALRRATATSVVSFTGTGMFVVCCPLIGLLRFGDPGRGVMLLSVLAASALPATALLARRPTLIGEPGDRTKTSRTGRANSRSGREDSRTGREDSRTGREDSRSGREDSATGRGDTPAGDEAPPRPCPLVRSPCPLVRSLSSLFRSPSSLFQSLSSLFRSPSPRLVSPSFPVRSASPLFRPDTLVWGGAAAQGMGLLLIAVTTSYPLALLAVAAAGIGEGPQLTGLLAVRHREAPDDVRAQIFTTGASLKIAGFAVGAGIAGPLANWSLRGCLLVAAGVQVLAVLTYLTSGPARPRFLAPPPDAG